MITASNPLSCAADARKSARAGSSSISSRLGCGILLLPDGGVRSNKAAINGRNALLTASAIKSRFGAHCATQGRSESMFASLIRRKSAGCPSIRDRCGVRIDHRFAVDHGPAAGRAARRRTRFGDASCRQVGRRNGNQQLIRVKNMSAGGIMAIVGQVPEVGEQVQSNSRRRNSLDCRLDPRRSGRLQVRSGRRPRRASRRAQAAAWLPLASTSA